MVNERDMEDTYLPAFQAGVEKGNASSMMCSYNAESAGEGIFGTGKRGNHQHTLPCCLFGQYRRWLQLILATEQALKGAQFHPVPTRA